MIPIRFTLIRILAPISQRSILMLPLTIFLMFLTTSLIILLLEFQILHLNFLVVSDMCMQSSDLLAVTTELFHWQWMACIAGNRCNSHGSYNESRLAWKMNNVHSSQFFALKWWKLVIIQETVKELKRNVNGLTLGRRWPSEWTLQKTVHYIAFWGWTACIDDDLWAFCSRRVWGGGGLHKQELPHYQLLWWSKLTIMGWNHKHWFIYCHHQHIYIHINMFQKCRLRPTVNMKQVINKWKNHSRLK